MPGKLLKKLFKKKLKRQEQILDYQLKNKQGRVIKDMGTSKETPIRVKDVPIYTKSFHHHRKWKESLNKKSTGGAVGPNGVL
jgi:hypothetical protein